MLRDVDSRPLHAIAEFYREEFIKHHRCLQQQRDYYSEGAITEVETALKRIISQLEQLSAKEDAPQLVSLLLKKFDVVTGLSAWSDPKQTH
jgi:hypothetical protein